jgi:hypothetical protein
MTHVTGGLYRLFVPETTPLTPNAHYTAEITANAGTNRVGFFEFKFKPLARVVTEPV